MANTHAVMKSSLAKALIEAGVEHHDLGGFIGSIVNPVTSLIKGVGSDLTTQNNYNAQLAPTQTSNYQPTINTAQGNVGAAPEQLNQNISQQQNLAQQLLNQSQGQGPNPAQAMLNQNTGANVANQAALMASQRGASANPALVARNAAMQGANIQQNAIGQAAGLNAQQQLAAQNQLSGLYGNIGQEALGAQNANTQLLGTAGSLQNAQNAGNVANYGMQQGINSGVAGANANAVNKTTGGLMGGIGAGLTMLPMGGAAAPAAGGGFSGAVAGGAGDAGIASAAPLMIAYKGGEADLKDGGDVPGKAKYPGNDERNDVVPALLSKGEVVLPNSVTQSPDMEKKATEFLKHLKGKKDGGYDKVANAKKTLKERVEALEKCMGGKI